MKRKNKTPRGKRWEHKFTTRRSLRNMDPYTKRSSMRIGRYNYGEGIDKAMNGN